MSRTAPYALACNDFFRQLEAAKDRILVAEYDGVIAPFRADRCRAEPYPIVREFLGRIMTSCATRLVIASGRAAREVPPLLGLSPPPEIWGINGIEKIDAKGCYQESRVSEKALEVLAEAEYQLERERLGENIEVKLAAIAIHWRGLSSSDAFNIRTKALRILQLFAAGPDLVLAEFEEGVELRLSSANKGSGLRNFLSTVDPHVPVAYLGDDDNDEDAFRVLNGRGLTVRVGATHRLSAAQVWLRPPDELVQFLNEWIRACSSPMGSRQVRA